MAACARLWWRRVYTTMVETWKYRIKSNRKNWIKVEKEIAFNGGGRRGSRRRKCQRERERRGGEGLSGGGGSGRESTSTWWWWLQKQNHEERERDEREVGANSKGGEEVLCSQGRRRSSSKGKEWNRGHTRGEEFLCPKIRDTNAVVSGNRVCILLQNILKVVLQIPKRLFPEPRWYLLAVFNNKLFVAYYRGSRVNHAGIVLLNFKNVTVLFLIAVHF